jgi:hypothetical protein
MEIPQSQIDELKQIAPDMFQAVEGGQSYIRIAGLKLPNGCIPATCDVLLCPGPRDGYQSRLFFSSKVVSHKTLNWNSEIRILGEKWYAFSWATSGNLRLAEKLQVHLNGLRP